MLPLISVNCTTIGTVLPSIPQVNTFGVTVVSKIAQLSVADIVTIPGNTVTGLPGDGFTMIELQVIAGACVSFTVTVNEHAVLFPAASVTTKVFVVTPTGNVDPDAKPVVCTVLA